MHMVPLSQSSASSCMDQTQLDYETRYKTDTLPPLSWLHCHDFYELYIHFQGARRLFVDNRALMLQPDQLVVLPPFVMHGLMEHLPDLYERGTLYISIDAMKKLGCDYIDLDRLFASFVEQGQFLFQLTAPQAKRCKELLQLLDRQLKPNDSLDRFSKYANLLALIEVLCSATHSGAIDANKLECATRKSENPIEPLLTYINAHFTEKLSLEDLARQYGMSTSYVSHEFARYTSHSVYDYILYRRILLAKQMIHSSTPMTDIAYQCGFSDYSCFLRAFTRIAGQSPSSYRKQIRHDASRLIDHQSNTASSLSKNGGAIHDQR